MVIDLGVGSVREVMVVRMQLVVRKINEQQLEAMVLSSDDHEVLMENQLTIQATRDMIHLLIIVVPQMDDHIVMG